MKLVVNLWKSNEMDAKTSATSPTGEEKKGRRQGRGANYDEEDINFLLDIITNHTDVINNKKTDASSRDAKKLAWKQVASEYNENKEAKYIRSIDSLKLCYKNAQARARKELGDHKLALYKTGGGSIEYKLNHTSERLVAQNRDLYIPPANPYDCDADYAKHEYNPSDCAGSDSEESDISPVKSKYQLVVDDDILNECEDLIKKSVEEKSKKEESPSPMVKGVAQQKSPILGKRKKKLNNVPAKTNSPNQQKKVHNSQQAGPSALVVGKLSITTPKSTPSSSLKTTSATREAVSKIKKKYVRKYTSHVENQEQVTDDEDENYNEGSQESASGLFDVEAQNGSSSNSKRRTAAKARRPPSAAKHSVKQRRLGSHILASQRFAKLALLKMSILEETKNYMLEKHDLELEILSTTLDIEKEKLEQLKQKNKRHD